MLLARIMSYHVITMEIGNASRIIIVLPLSTVWRNTRPLLQCQLSFQLVRQLPGAGHSGHRTLIVSVELIKDDKRCANCRASDCVSRCRAACGALSYFERRGTICTSVCTHSKLCTSVLFLYVLYLLDLHPHPGPGAVVEHDHEVGAHL